MKKVFSVFMLIAMLLTSCGGDDKKTTVNKNNYVRVAVAVTPSLDCFPLYVAQETGIADSMHIDLILQTHLAKADCDSALVNGSVSAAMTDYVRADFIAQQLKVLAAQKAAKKTDKKSKNNALSDSLTVIPHDNLQMYFFTNSKARVKEAKQLTDKMVAVDRQGASALVAQHVLDSVKLKDDKTFLVEMRNMMLRQRMILANVMDAVVVPEPYSTAIRRAGHKAIYSTGHVGEKSIGAVAVRKHSKEVQAIYNRACDSINKYGIHHYDSILVKRLNLPTATAQAVPNHRFKNIK